MPEPGEIWEAGQKDIWGLIKGYKKGHMEKEHAVRSLTKKGVPKAVAEREVMALPGWSREGYAGGGVQYPTQISQTEYEDILGRFGAGQIPFTSTGVPTISERDLGKLRGFLDVGVTPEQQSLIDLIHQMTTGEYGRFRQMLEGKPDYGLLEMAVISPARRELREQTLPSIADIYSGGPLGAGYQTGARRAAQERATTELADALATIRYQADVDAQNQLLAALGQTPGMMGVLSVPQTTEIANIERALGALYQDIGLSQQQQQMDMLAAQSMLQQAQAQEATEQANRAAQYGTLGSLAGTLGGIALAPFTGGLSLAAGPALGAGAGLMLGGTPQAGYQTIAGGGQDLASLMLMQNLMRQRQPISTVLGGTTPQTLPWYYNTNVMDYWNTG